MNIKNSLIGKLFLRFRNLILYGVIGTVSASVDFVVFYTLNTIYGIHYLISNTTSIGIGISISFYLNRNFNFKVKDNGFKRFLIFSFVGLSGLLISSVILFILVEIFHFQTILSKILSIILVVIIQFLINKSITFKKGFE